MATNEVSIEGLTKMVELVNDRIQDPEILAYNTLLKNHLRRQKGLNPTKHRGQYYVYDKKTRKLIRVRRA